MSAPTRAEVDRALDASIARWQANASARHPGDYGVGANGCALCQLFVLRTGSCEGCPIAERTGHEACVGSPYAAAYDAWLAWVALGIWRHVFRTRGMRLKAEAQAKADLFVGWLTEIRRQRRRA